MNKIKLITIISVLSIGLMFANAYGEGITGKGWSRAYQVSEIIGAGVANHQMEYLGRVKDFVIDTHGRVTFVVLAHGGFLGIGEKRVAVPFSALSYGTEKGYLVLDISKDKFQSTPAYEKANLRDGKWAEDIYKYFGQHPYWSEWSEEMGTTIDLLEELKEEERQEPGNPYMYLYGDRAVRPVFPKA